MDRVTAPENHSAEIPWLDSQRFDGSNDGEGGSPNELDAFSGLVPETATASTTPIGRSDIDTAVLHALSHALSSDRGFPEPGWVSPDRDGRGIVCHSEDRGDSTPGSSPTTRSDIDVAVLEALRRAIVSDPLSWDA